MSAMMLASIPFQIVCQIVVPGSAPINFTETQSSSAPITSPSNIEPTILPNGYVAYPNVEAAYKIYNESVLWKVARKRCITEGGNLAVIDSVEKFNYLSRLRESKGVTHVGIHSLFDDYEWVSVKTGLPLTNIPWASGEPNGNLHCAMVKHETGGLGNFNCATAFGDFVCEIPIPDNYKVAESSLGQLAAN